MLNTVLLICCSWPIFVSLPRLMFGENLTHPEPYSKIYIGGSWAAQRNGMELPYYPTGFK